MALAMTRWQVMKESTKGRSGRDGDLVGFSWKRRFLQIVIRL